MSDGSRSYSVRLATPMFDHDPILTYKVVVDPDELVSTQKPRLSVVGRVD